VLDDLAQDARRAFGARAALLPALNGIRAEAEARGKPGLGHAKLAPERLDVDIGRDVDHNVLAQLTAGEGQRLAGSGQDLGFRHGTPLPSRQVSTIERLAA
jgi:hypothetical protein